MHLRVYILPSVALVATTLALPSPTLHRPNQFLNKRTIPDLPIYKEIVVLEEYCQSHDPELRTPKCEALYVMRGELLDELRGWFEPHLSLSKYMRAPVGAGEDLELLQYRHKLFVRYFFETDDKIPRQAKEVVSNRWGLVFNPTPLDGNYLTVPEAVLGQAALKFASRSVLQPNSIGEAALELLHQLADWSEFFWIDCSEGTNSVRLPQYLDLGKEALGYARKEIFNLETTCKANPHSDTCSALKDKSADMRDYLDWWFDVYSPEWIPDNFKAEFQHNQALWEANYHSHLVSFEPSAEQEEAFERCLAAEPLVNGNLGYINRVAELNTVEAQIVRNLIVRCAIPMIRWDTPEDRAEFSQTAESDLSGLRTRWINLLRNIPKMPKN